MDRAASVAVCRQAAGSPLCCWEQYHGPATHVVTLDYGSRGLCEHAVCDYCTSEAEAGRIPQQHSDSVLLEVRASGDEGS